MPQLPSGLYTIRSGDGNRPIGVYNDKVIVLSENDSAPKVIHAA